MYREFLANAIEMDDLSEATESIKSAIKTMVRRDGESAAVNFVLYTFYSTDKVAKKYVSNGFPTEGDRDFFTRLLLIEQDLGEHYIDLGYKDLFSRALVIYEKGVAHA